MFEQNSPHIAVLDPSPRTRWHASRAVKMLGYTPVAFAHIDELIEQVAPGGNFEALLLSIPSAPDDVQKLVGQVREMLRYNTPLIMSARKRQIRGLSLLHAGPDDAVLPEPSTFEEMYFMLEFFLRQRNRPVVPRSLDWQEFSLLSPFDMVDVAGTEIRLTPIEFDLAAEFFRHMNRPLGREHLEMIGWQSGVAAGSRTLDANVSKLRRKLGLYVDQPHGLSLHAVWGMGYQLSQLGKRDAPGTWTFPTDFRVESAAPSQLSS
ncbi:winged helix-turn-helix transcriptional regulator [Variovorax sp. 54]|uniref:winged helix-turn-helix transcriptional regulator n=1 Tax=Variovorax sp. 54 TaxID=2035212 RepID=UPI000C181A0C|nr:winged helix-turn-helix domain-containing protein [Variovorax sp. 54]